MIRYPYIYNQVLQLYRAMDRIVFPLEPSATIDTIRNCRVMSYQDFARLNQCSIRDVVLLCESKSGCTHYDVTKDRYLILWNADNAENNVAGRKRWTKAHELGHVILKHLPLIAEPLLAENSFNNLTAPEFEAEADQFAATFLCPMPLFKELSINGPVDIQRVFGLSAEASVNRWMEYLKWLRYHRKTAWENDMKRVYRGKCYESDTPYYSYL